MGVISRRSVLASAAVTLGGLLSFPTTSIRAAARPRVVVIGGGFAGASCAAYLGRLGRSIDVALADPDNPYIACPMSNSVVTGLRDFDYITVSRQRLSAAGFRYVKDTAVAVDTVSRSVRLGGGSTLFYDRLVVAPGIRLLWGKPEGYDEAAAQVMPHAWMAGSQTRLLAARLRALGDGSVVAISVPAGPMRCPPGPFERATLIAAYLQRHRRRCKVLIFDGNNHFPRQETFSEVWQTLYPGMIEWISVVDGGAVTRVEPRSYSLYTASGAQRADLINIIPVQAPARLAVQVGLASEHGWCPVNPATFESRLIPGVHVIGDACIADPMPKSGSAAHAQGKLCALAIAAALTGAGHEPPVLESVCYSLLARDQALSIHGRFRVAADTIQQLPAEADGTRRASAEQEARNASDWYRNILRDSFG